MKMVTIRPVAEKPDAVLQKEWDAIVKLGKKEVPAVTARQNIVLSKGAYEIEPESVPVEIKGGIATKVEDMDNTALKLIVANSGKRIQKQKVKRSDLVNLVKKILDEQIEIVDEEVEVGED